MTSTSAQAKLPPPAIFTHDETLHAILLPPLALFLSDLSAPEHLIKLHDILDRFRTPESYHRIDVRLVESSELPPDGPAADATETAADKVETAGPAASDQDDGDQSAGQKVAQPTATREQTASRKRKRDPGEPVILPEGMGMAEYLLANPRTVYTEDEEESSTPSAAAVPNGDTSGAPEPKLSDDHTLAAVADGFTPTIPTVMPIPVHQLPPAAPTRRVRELRLDLRTLDAAALFHLETWRREVLGLQRLDLEHPDSIWYQYPSPSPSAPVEPSRPKKRPGNPPKRRSTARETAELPQEQAPATGAGADREDHGELVQALASHEDGANWGSTNGEAVEATAKSLPDVTILDALDSIEEQGVADASGPPMPQPVEEEGEPELDSIDLEPTMSPSPDVILDDLFDRREENDPDFVPPETKPQRNRVPRTNRSPTTNDLAGSSAFGNLDDIVDLTTEIDGDPTDQEVGPVESIDLVPKHLVPSASPPLSSGLGNKQDVAKRKRKYIFIGVEIPAPRRRPPSTEGESSDSASAKKRKMVLDLTSPEKQERKIKESRKSIRSEMLQDEASVEQAEESASMAIEDDYVMDIHPAGGTEYTVPDGKQTHPETIVPSITRGDDEWDFLREL
jgi:hypothetical protein